MCQEKLDLSKSLTWRAVCHRKLDMSTSTSTDGRPLCHHGPANHRPPTIDIATAKHPSTLSRRLFLSFGLSRIICCCNAVLAVYQILIHGWVSHGKGAGNWFNSSANSKVCEGKLFTSIFLDGFQYGPGLLSFFNCTTYLERRGRSIRLLSTSLRISRTRKWVRDMTTNMEKLQIDCLKLKTW
ncbi:hypothetical protein GE09DRAFT_389198 [Coniochaeta sp. 2T2.1]|nr:hypothetical protein GE09DRAFT_389198 [Coniochaeta sp. 2T2.1]